MQKKLNIVFQTHWDREWYLPFEKYRFRLLHVMKRIIKALDEKEISTFILDGQTLPLEDYLESAETKDKEKVLKYIKEGQIIIGPWYIAMDEFLVHGESMIRNLEFGHESCLFFSNEQKLGYIPDTFGHVGQMPQILNHFGIFDAIMWRGVEPKHSEFIWKGIDESQCFTIFLSEGYYQPILNQKDYVSAIENYIKKIETYAHTNELLLTAGGDHLMPIDLDINTRVMSLEKAIKDTEFEITDYETYIKKVKNKVDISKLESIEGELRTNTHCYILPNVLSTRSYLKVNNQKLEDLMLGFIEPFVASQALFKKIEKHSYIDDIWKNILKNQPHDSICGCSVDEVHKENEHRSMIAFQQIESFIQGISEDYNIQTIQYYKESHRNVFEDDQYFSIFNPHPYDYNGIVEFKLWIKKESPLHNGFSVKDKQGKIYDVSINEVFSDRLFISPLDYPPAFRDGKTYDVTINVKNLKAMTLSTFECIEGINQKVSLNEDTYTIENKHIKVEIKKDGSLKLTSFKTNSVLDGIHQFYSELDSGDSYNYSKPENDKKSYAYLSQNPIRKSSKHTQTLTYHLTMSQPAGLDESRQNASASLVESHIKVTLTLHNDQKMVFVKTNIDNKAKNQRLRILYPLHEKIDVTTSDSVFELKKRNANRIESFQASRLKEVPVVVDPSLSMIICHKSNENFVVYHRGLHEYQVQLNNEFSALNHTIIRSVGYLSRDDFKSRGGAAGPNLKTPEAQCIKSMDFDYAFGVHDLDVSLVSSYQEALRYRMPVVKLRGFSMEEPKSLIKLSHQEVVLTSTRHISIDQIEIRLWNPLNQGQSVTIYSDHHIAQIMETDMLKQIKKVQSETIELKPHEIKTIQITYKR
jgi:alpha-mannosidase